MSSTETLAQQANKTNELASVKYGIINQPMPIVGKTIGEVRQSIGSAWNLPEGSEAFKDKTKLSDDYVIQASDNIEFVRRMGEKG